MLLRSVVVMLVVLANVLPALAQQDNKLSREKNLALAEQLYRQGRDQMERGRHVQACRSFDASLRYDMGTGGTLWHLAKCLEHTGYLASAWARYRELQGFALSQGEEHKARAALERANAIEPKIARLTIDVQPTPGAPEVQVRHNGEALDAAAWGSALPVDPGTHRVVAEAEGYLPFEQLVLVRRDASVVTLEVPALVPKPENPDESTLPEEAKAGRDDLNPWYRHAPGWSLAGAGLLCFLAAPFLFEKASVLKTEGQAERDFSDQERVRLRSLRFRAAGLGALSAGAGFALGSALVFRFRPRKESQSVEVQPTVTLQSAGLQISGVLPW